ncbi:MAG TPA: hypothetical protein VJ860_06455 [Polyangia bacterium]|jgi:hypothetical protein|nr:hypothetical protein [Polyangia bacterium]
MATLNKKFVIAALASLGFSGCGKLVGLDTPSTPLAQIHFLVTGVPSVLGADAGEQDGSWLSGADAGEQDGSAVPEADPGVQALQLRIALVWGAQVQPEPFCVFPQESDAAKKVVAAGCPDSFRFVPNRPAADVPVELNLPGTIDLFDLPAADLMVGDLTARIAYASLIIYDDRNGNGVLDFHHPKQGHNHQDNEHYDPGTPATRDIPYGASFISMTQPDQRVAYREGGFNGNVAFYPRYNCEGPPASFSILSAGGFSQTDALAAALNHELPKEDPTTCNVATLDEALVTIPLHPVSDPLQPPDFLKELACTVNNTDVSTFYSKPDTAPDLTHLDWACVGFPELPGDTAGVASGQQLVVAGSPSEPCQYVNHYILRGCDTGPNCSAGRWDYTTPENPPPAWWPCPQP